MRRILLLAAVALAACQPPAPEQRADTPPPVVEAACNTLTPDLTKPIRLSTEPVAAAALAPELPGGPINPGTYDLTAGNVTGGAPAWTEERFVAIDVAESDAGVVVSWAEGRMGADTQRWSATFHQGPPAQLAFTCGREGQAEIEFAAAANQLQLRLPDPGGTGQMYLVFTRRG